MLTAVPMPGAACPRLTPLQQRGALLHLCHIPSSPLDALGVLLDVGRAWGAGAAGAARTAAARTARAAAAGAGRVQTACAERALNLLQDALQLGGELGEGLDIGRRRDALGLIEVGVLELQTDAGRGQAPEHGRRLTADRQVEIERQPAKGLVAVARPDVDCRVLDRRGDLLPRSRGDGGGDPAGGGTRAGRGLLQE